MTSRLGNRSCTAAHSATVDASHAPNPAVASGAKLLKITVKSAIDVQLGGAGVILFVLILHSKTQIHEYSNDDRILALQSKGHQPC